VAERVCHAGLRAARGLVPGTAVRVIDSDPANVECRLGGGGVDLDVVAQRSPLAWTQFDTLVSHAAQAFGPGTVHRASMLPRDLAGLGYNAAWIPERRQLVATNGTQLAGGSLLTVTVTHADRGARPVVAVAEAVATATLAVAPRGPAPGPPPS